MKYMAQSFLNLEFSASKFSLNLWCPPSDKSVDVCIPTEKWRVVLCLKPVFYSPGFVAVVVLSGVHNLAVKWDPTQGFIG